MFLRNNILNKKKNKINKINLGTPLRTIKINRYFSNNHTKSSFSFISSDSWSKIGRIKILSNELANYTHRRTCTRLLSGHLRFQSSAIPVTRGRSVVVGTGHALGSDAWNESFKIIYTTVNTEGAERLL